MRLIHHLILPLLLAIGLASCANELPELPASEEPLTINDGFFRQDIPIWTPDGVLHTEVVFRLRALRHERRVIMMIPGTLANGAGYYDIGGGGGFNAAELLAREGYVVVLVDLPGSGESYRPANGATQTAEYIAAALQYVGDVYREVADGRRIDVYGETGVGTQVALLLARRSWVRSVVMTAPAYIQFGNSPPVVGTLFNPAFYAFLDTVPDGYLPQDPMQIGFFLSTSDPSIVPAAITAIVGPPPATLGVAPYYDLRDNGALGPSGAMQRLASPVVAAEPARRPALIIGSDPDFVGDPAGTAEMVAAYGATGGGHADSLIINGASHLMRFDTIAEGPDSVFWTPILDFLDSH
jgi:pimeloyl-ACP methyl ester carboxylesterase